MTNLAIAGFFAVFAALTGYGFVSQRRRTRRMAETETTRSDQVLEGLVELKGTVRARETVRDPLSNDEAVLVDWELTKQELDADGDIQDRTIASGRREAVFDLEDEGGTIRVDPEGATLKMSGSNRHKETLRGHDDRLTSLREGTESDQGGTERAGVSIRADGVSTLIDFDTDDRRTYRAETLTPGDGVYVLGTATRDGEETIVGRGDTRGKYFLSDMSEAELSDTFASNQLLLGVIALGSAAAMVWFLLP
ncbi:GIDE domain-containing protein [Halapricum salinum]|uniref:RING-type E3 ubiquitin transferase n=1 Tax=Halapricum salinum TaxID=1457250 RepID=A0A4D6H818_9EURY|nr:GIDE domain-containing protein [Halapricum salinum]QCC49959.1 hypothetical protein DV733_01405 [Halapricum salinum]